MFLIKLKIIEKYIDEGYISKRKHPEEDLYILNYTPKTQYEGFWNEYTLNCRGLIIDSSGLIKARCFKKFFNYEESKSDVLKRLNKNLSFTVQEKLDGSLGILYWIKDKPFIATRGSFESKQAIEATKILQSYNKIYLDKSLTYLFEIIYPENRICVDYGNKRGLFFLSAFEIKSGVETDIETSFPCCKNFILKEDFSYLKELNLPNKEGFVVRFEDGYRFKIKFNDYIRLHNLIFSISSRSIWEYLKSKKEIPLDSIPDEIYKWIDKTRKNLEFEYSNIESESKCFFEKISHLPRKEFASKAKLHPHASVLFKMLDNKSYSDIIWKIIEPEYRTPNEDI
jgi:RNA ligase